MSQTNVYCIACAIRDAKIGKQPDDSVTKEYIEWLKTESRSSGVAGNEAWNAGVARAKSTYEPKLIQPHIYEYPGDVFVVFDPRDGGASIIGAYRYLEEAQSAIAMVI